MQQSEMDMDEDFETDDDTESSNQSGEATVVAGQRATWREIEKRRELMALSKMVGENIDDYIFNE